MDSIMQQYDPERIREFADEGEEAFREMQRKTYCADCGDVEVDEVGNVCDTCVADPRPEVLPSHLYTEIMGVCAKVLDPQNENVKRWDVVASVRDLAQMAMAAKNEAA